MVRTGSRMKSGKYVGPTACGTDTAQAQMILNSDNPPREVLFFFEIGTELVCTKDYDFGRTEPNEKMTIPWTQESRGYL